MRVVCWSRCSPPDCFGSRRTAPPQDWIDADTGHRVVRLTGDAGGSTLYFHDNAFSPEGDTADRQHAERDRHDRRGEDRHGRGAGGGDRAARARRLLRAAHARDLRTTTTRAGRSSRSTSTRRRTATSRTRAASINADETLSVVKNANATDPDGTNPRPPTRTLVPQLQRMFPGKRMEDLTPDQQLLGDQGGRPGAPRASTRRCSPSCSRTCKTGGSHGNRFSVRRSESPAVQSGRSRTSCCIATKAPGTSWIARGPSAPTAARCG